jgi:protein SCO1/2
VTRRIAVSALALVLAAPAVATTPGVPASEPPPLARDVVFEQHLGARLPLDARFVDETGAPVRLGDLVGSRPVLLVPAYYECPMLCTLVLNGVVRLLRALPLDVGDALDVIVFSIDPDETPALAAAKKDALLAEYRRPATAPGWHLLTGGPTAIAGLTDAIGFRYAQDPASGQFAHPSGVVVITPDGRVAQYFFGVEFPPRDVRLAVVEASAGRVGSVVDQLLLLCLQWDPTRGRYTASVMNAIRAGGVLVLLGLAAFVWQSRGRAAGPRGGP